MGAPEQLYTNPIFANSVIYYNVFGERDNLKELFSENFNNTLLLCKYSSPNYFSFEDLIFTDTRFSYIHKCCKN